MIEKWIRHNFQRLQILYDMAPYPIRNVLTTARGYPLFRARYNKLYWESLDELLKREKFTLEEIKNYQHEKLAEIVNHAYRSVPFYRRTFTELKLNPADVREVKDLVKLPVLTRDLVRDNWRDLLSSEIPERKRVRVFTSGTSGSGLPVIYDEKALTENWAFKARQKIWAKALPREWRISLYGSRITPINKKRPPFWTFNYLERQILLSIFHISESNKAAYLDFLSAHTDLVLEGFPSVLGILGSYILQDHKCVPMKVVFTDGEPLYAHARQRIEKAFSTKVFSHYGMTEWAGLIQECEAGEYHQISDYGILEILNENNEEVSPGEEGYFVWTGFTNTAMPLIRYKIGDKGIMMKDRECLCKRPFPLVNPTITREGDYLMAPNGTILSPRAINQVLKDKTAFKACQFVQKDLRTITVRYVPRNPSAKNQSADVRKSLMEMLGKSVDIRVREAKDPIQYRSGKIPLILSREGGNIQQNAEL